MVTLKDIAEEAGVSVMTVSRVVNKQTSKVSLKNRRKIEEIVKRRGYVPNSSARSLSSKASRIIAVIVQGKDARLEYPYNATMVGDICYYVQEHGYSPMLFFVDDYRDITERLRTWNVEGAVFLGMFDENIKSIQEDNRIPLVFTDGYSSMRQITNVGIDDYKGGELAARYLIERGHRVLAFLGTTTSRSGVVRQRLYGFLHGLREAGLTLRAECQFDNEPTAQELKALCSGREPVTGLFATADIVAVHAIESLKSAGLRVPQDCSVLGFDNMFFGAYTSPKLTTIGQDINRKAKVATEVLFRHIAQADSPAENITLDVEVIERESVSRR